jgi:hypothetical protein
MLRQNGENLKSDEGKHRKKAQGISIDKESMAANKDVQA